MHDIEWIHSSERFSDKVEAYEMILAPTFTKFSRRMSQQVLRSMMVKVGRNDVLRDNEPILILWGLLSTNMKTHSCCKEMLIYFSSQYWSKRKLEETVGFPMKYGRVSSDMFPWAKPLISNDFYPFGPEHSSVVQYPISITGWTWWFGTCLYFHILGIIIPIG